MIFFVYTTYQLSVSQLLRYWVNPNVAILDEQVNIVKFDFTYPMGECDFLNSHFIFFLKISFTSDHPTMDNSPAEINLLNI